MTTRTASGWEMLVRPLREWTGGRRWFAVVLGTALCAAVGIGIGCHRQPF